MGQFYRDSASDAAKVAEAAEPHADDTAGGEALVLREVRRIGEHRRIHFSGAQLIQNRRGIGNEAQVDRCDARPASEVLVVACEPQPTGASLNGTALRSR